MIRTLRVQYERIRILRIEAWMKRKETTSFLLLYTVRYSIKALKKHALPLSDDFRRLRKIMKKTIRFVRSVCPHATTRLPLNGFS